MNRIELKDLPEVRGRYTKDAPLGAKGWFRCGGTADILFKPKDLEDLQHFMRECPADVPVYIFGALSNCIIRDGGVRGVVIRLGRVFSKIEVEGDLVTAGALALDANVATIAAENGLGGLEFLSGIPGTIGGAVKMNAGCYGVETKDVLVEATIINRKESIQKYIPCHSEALAEESPKEGGDPSSQAPRDDGYKILDMTYRHTNIAEGQLVVGAVFKGVKENPETVKQRIAAIKEKRDQSQPIREKTGGSTFANPSVEDLQKAGLSTDTKVWQLIDNVGGRGLEIGGAQMSEKHCNFMINKGDATAGDLEALGEEIRKRVQERYGIALRWEIRRMGERAQ